MRKLAITIAAAALCLPSVAAAQFNSGDIAPWSPGEGFGNRGQCESFLAQFNNELRRNPEMRDLENRELSGGEWNRLFHSQWDCTRGDDGRYYVTWAL